MHNVPQKDLNRMLVRLRRELALIDQAIRALTRYRAPSSRLALHCSKLSGLSKLAGFGDQPLVTNGDTHSHE